MNAAAGRLLFDVSSLARWTGTPVGIPRVEHELAGYAFAHPDAITLIVFDPRIGCFRALRREWAALTLGWSATIDTIALERPMRPANRGRLSRYPLLIALEQRRLTTNHAALARAIGAAQRVLLAPRPGPPFLDAGGKRSAVVPLELALGPPIAVGAGDTIATAGYDWFYKDVDTIAAAKRQSRFRYATMCYDLIPLQFPQFFPPADVARFRDYWARTLPLADTVICNSRRVRDDLTWHCQAAELQPPNIAVVPLGYRPFATAELPALPNGLTSGRYILFVSTIEPRKGHGLLLEAWRRLLTAGVPQRRGFTLVFAGRLGWGVEEVRRQLADARGFHGTLRHFDQLDDAALAALYRGAAFCLYPSHYEGFGLPVIEAFAQGKATIVSTGGALPETVGALSPCLDPTDAAAWHSTIAHWIEQPTARRVYEERIRASFTHPTWEQAAARFFVAASA